MIVVVTGRGALLGWVVVGLVARFGSALVVVWVYEGGLDEAVIDVWLRAGDGARAEGCLREAAGF